MTSTVSSGRRPRRLRGYVWAVVLAALAVTALPLTGYLVTGVSQAQDSSEQASQGEDPRAGYWRAVRDGSVGVSTVTGPETNVLIHNGAQNWRQLRNDVIAVIGAWAVAAIVVAVALYHALTGGARLEKPLSGELIDRWSVFDRVIHWYTATLFFLLAVTGLSLLWGRYVLIPVMGPEGFAAWANIAKPLHDYLSPLFIVGLVLMCIKWLRHNIFTGYDLTWIRQAGGYLGGSHPPAGFCNAGEKMFYWTLVLMGALMIGSGIVLLFPNLGFERQAMQWANLLHGFSSLFVIGFACLHVYLATIGNEGSLRGMINGKVDAVWAHQHHSEWYKEVAGRRQPLTGAGGPVPSTSPADRAR